MSLIKFARAEITGVKGSESRLGRTASLDHFADYDDYRTDDGYIYVRVRAISSRVNKNHDGWPSEELAKSFRTFLGKPIFVDHNNSDPERHRGVVVDAKLHVEEPGRVSALDPYYAHAPSEHLPPTWIELLLETDAKTFPKLAKAITSGEIDGVSMGCNVERSKCSHCGNWASVPEQYCQHIREKGAEYDYYRDGNKTSKKSYEDCYDIGFFEISYVFDPADETALIREIRSNHMQKAAKTAGDFDYAPDSPDPAAEDRPVQPQAIKPHRDLQYMSPDTVAETVDGISPDTYGALWNIINSPDYKGAPIGGDRHDPYGEHGEPMVEDPASARDVMMGNKGDMASHFHKLTPEQQQEVNAAMEAQDAERDAMMQRAQYENDLEDGYHNQHGARVAKVAANPAAFARQNKEAHPEQYCPKCLWHTNSKAQPGDAPQACPRHGGPMRGQDSSGADTGPVTSAEGKACADCGKNMNPAEVMVAGKNGVCGACARKNQKEVTGAEKTAEYDPDMGYMDHGEPYEESSCPMCGGPGMFIGTLGRRNHHRCRNCGMDFSDEGEAPEDHNNFEDPSGQPMPPRGAATAEAEEEDEDELAKYRKRFQEERGKSGDVTSAEKTHGGCSVCGSRSIDWTEAGSVGQCRNCGHHMKDDSSKESAAAKCDHCGKPLDSAAKAEGNRVCSDCEKNWSTVQKAADTQQLPQSELVHAPQDVNTLRQEQVCPVCGNQIDDGKCGVCGFEEPPEGFGNPDLDAAQQVNQEQEAADMAQSGPGGQPPVPVPDAQGSPPPGPSPMGQPGAGAGSMPLQAAASVNVSSDKTSANSGGTKGGQPILPATQQATDRPKNEKRIQDSSKPVESSSREETMTDKSKTSAPDNVADRLQSDQHRTQVADVDGEGGVITEENPIGHKNVSVDGVGAVDNDENPEGHKEESLESGLKEEVGGPTKTWGKGEGDSLGQHSPVGGGGDSALASTKRSLQIFPVTDPKSVKLDAGLKEEVGPPTSTFGDDSFHTTDPVTNEAFPTWGGVEPEGKGVPDKSPFPPAAEGVKAARRQFMASLRLAETEIALGLIPAEQKLDRMSELEGEATEAIEAQLAAYSKVKTAGLQKTVKKTGGSLPSLKRSSVEHESTIRQVEAHDETVELAESIFS